MSTNKARLKEFYWPSKDQFMTIYKEEERNDQNPYVFYVKVNKLKMRLIFHKVFKMLHQQDLVHCISYVRMFPIIIWILKQLVNSQLE